MYKVLFVSLNPEARRVFQDTVKEFVRADLDQECLQTVLSPREFTANKARSVDLIILDIRPGQAAGELFTIYKKLGTERPPLICLYSAHAPDVAQRACNRGARDCLIGNDAINNPNILKNFLKENLLPVHA